MGAKALARNNINYLVWGNRFLITLFRNPFICHHWSSLADVGIPPTWEKGTHLPPRTTKLCNLRIIATPLQLPLLNQIRDPFLSKKDAEVWSPPRDARNVTGSTFSGGGTGTLDKLADSHTRLAIYPTLAIHYQRGVIALHDTRFKGRR